MRPQTTLWIQLALMAFCILPGLAESPEQRIAFQRNDPPSVTIMFMDGSQAVDLAPTRKCSMPYVTPALAPNGNTVLFSGVSDGMYKFFTWRLDEHNSAVGEPKRFIADSEVSEEFPSWSPDGKLLAFLATDKDKKITLRLVNDEGSSMRVLTQVTYRATPTWSPDGKQLLYIDLVNGKPVLFNIPISGGKGLPFRPDSRIISACYSPDGQQIAALLEQESGMADLYILPPFGIGGRAVVRNIVGSKSICWRTEDNIIINASKVGSLGGKAFWMVNPNGGTPKGLTGYADPKQVSYFTVQRCDLTPYVPVAEIPTAPSVKPKSEILPPEEVEDIHKPDLTDQLALHSVTIISPLNEKIVQGKVPLQLIARKNVASVSILISGQVVFNSLTDNKGLVPKISWNWDTQQLKPFDPVSGISGSYQDNLLYPDGTYTICAQALDAGRKVIDQHIIKVIVQNELPDGVLPGDTANIQFRFTMQSPVEYYRVHGDGELIGARPGQADELNAFLDAAVYRGLQRPLTNGRYTFRTELYGPTDRPALTFGEYRQQDLPEAYGFAYYSLDKFGELVEEQSAEDGVNAFLPLGRISLSAPDSLIKMGASWEKPMWVVTDLLDREATIVNAKHTVEAMEWVDGKRALRVRSDYQVDSDLFLHISPAISMPGQRGSRQADIPAPILNEDGEEIENDTPPTPLRKIEVWKIEGVRYSWVDLEGQRLLKVDDRILYTILKNKLPPPPAIKEDNNIDEQSRASVAWYLVHYQYKIYQQDSSAK